MSHPYDYLIEPGGDSTANKVLRLVGRGRRVLELGTAAGVMTRELQRQECRVTGVEYVPELADRAAPFCERILIADLEDLDFEREFAGECFDVIVAADVLEHLKDPSAVLRRLPALLSDGGALVVSVPNIAYKGLLAGLLNGRFQYRPKGLLDQTHLRFFTRYDLEWRLLEAGWLPMQWDAYRVPVVQSEFHSDWLDLELSARKRLDARPEADVYQFIVRAVPASEPGYAEYYQEQIESLRTMLEAERVEARQLRDQHELNLVSLAEHQLALVQTQEAVTKMQERAQAFETRAQELERTLGQTKAMVARAALNRARSRLGRLLRWLATRLGDSQPTNPER